MKTALITGATGGIGRAAALKFSEEGYAVFIGYNSGCAKAAALQKEIIDSGGNAAIFQSDLSDKDSAERMTSDILRLYKHIDVLVNCAGISEVKPFTDITREDWLRMFDVNIHGVFYCTRAVVMNMLERKCGSIVNVSSVWGQRGASCETHYSASKSAVIGFTKSLARELALSNIRVNCICPGAVDTEMNSFLTESEKMLLLEEIPLKRLAKPMEIADAIFFLSQAEYITGQVLSVNGGWFI